MLTCEQIEQKQRAAGYSEQSIAEARHRRERLAARQAKQKQLEDEYERHRRTHSLDYFEELADEQAARLGV
jgi:hypothetical protein